MNTPNVSRFRLKLLAMVLFVLVPLAPEAVDARQISFVRHVVGVKGSGPCGSPAAQGAGCDALTIARNLASDMNTSFVGIVFVDPASTTNNATVVYLDILGEPCFPDDVTSAARPGAQCPGAVSVSVTANDPVSPTVFTINIQT